MEFNQLLRIVGQEPVFETGLLLAGELDPDYVRRQLSGWVSSGKLWQLRRGLYAVAPPFQKNRPHPFVVANRLAPGSYISLQSALSHYHLIPEYVPTVTSVTTRRPGEWQNPLGRFSYRRIQPQLLFGYEIQTVDQNQQAYIAAAPKALLDLVYLTPGGDSLPFLESLRLQNLDQLDLDQLHQLARQSDKPKLLRSAKKIGELVAAESEVYQSL